MQRIVIVSASGDYLDPWHRFADTSAEIAAVLGPLGEVALTDAVDAALASPDPSTRLLVVNVGNAGSGTPSPAARDGLVGYVNAGGSLLVVHSSATAFPDWDAWEALVGGRWVRGTTWHPPKAPGRVVVDPAHPMLVGLSDFEVDDEFYTDLRVGNAVRVVAHHVLDAVAHPLAWEHRVGAGRVVYVALGHDVDAYRWAGMRDLLHRSASWLLTERTPASG